MKAKAHRLFRAYNPEGQHHKFANHLAHCQSICCANPRRVFGKVTLQERRAFQCVSD